MTSALPPDGIQKDPSDARALVGSLVDIGLPDQLGQTMLEVAARHSNRNLMLHGGIIAMPLDTACGFTGSMRLCGGHAMTGLVPLSLSTSCVTYARIGDRITETGYPGEGDSDIVFVRAALRDESDRLIATCQRVFRKTQAARNP